MSYHNGLSLGVTVGTGFEFTCRGSPREHEPATLS